MEAFSFVSKTAESILQKTNFLVKYAMAYVSLKRSNHFPCNAGGNGKC